MLVYTSITKSYLPKARVLALSLKAFHPDWYFAVVFSDELPIDFDLTKEPFDEVVMISDLGISNLKSWIFKHTIVELCTAVKGVAGLNFSKRENVDKVMYIDPDIKIFSSLNELDLLLNEHDILLTPHLLKQEESLLAIQDNELSALKHGVYNLGFMAVKAAGQGLEFLEWWSSRLSNLCYDDIPSGLFTDQRWCDLAPAFFDKLHIVRDEGYNVATWNIAHRKLTLIDDVFYAGGKRLKFYHFTGYDSGAGFQMLSKYASNESVAQALWSSYADDLSQSGQNYDLDKSWKYACYLNGETIPKAARVMYRSDQSLINHYDDPFGVEGDSFYSYYKNRSLSARLLDCREAINLRVWCVAFAPRCARFYISKLVDSLRFFGFQKTFAKLLRVMRNRKMG